MMSDPQKDLQVSEVFLPDINNNRIDVCHVEVERHILQLHAL